MSEDDGPRATVASGLMVVGGAMVTNGMVPIGAAFIGAGVALGATVV